MVGLAPQQADRSVGLGAAEALPSALCTAVGGNYARRAFSGEAPLAQTIGQLLGGAVVLLPLALVLPPSRIPSGDEAAAMLALTLVCTALGYLAFFHLVATIGATQALSVEFAVPVFATLWGVLFVREPLTAGATLGGAIILTGCALVSGWEPWRRGGHTSPVTDERRTPKHFRAGTDSGDPDRPSVAADDSSRHGR